MLTEWRFQTQNYCPPQRKIVGGYAKLSIRIQGIPLMHGAWGFTMKKTCEDYKM